MSLIYSFLNFYDSTFLRIRGYSCVFKSHIIIFLSISVRIRWRIHVTIFSRSYRDIWTINDNNINDLISSSWRGIFIQGRGYMAALAIHFDSFIILCIFLIYLFLLLIFYLYYYCFILFFIYFNKPSTEACI